MVSTQFLTAADVTAKEVFLSQGEVTVNKENAKISVTYSGPVLNPESYYTLACKATDHDRFIKDDGTSINGRSSEGSYFVFEPGTEKNTYYIKSVVSGKYLNHSGSNISASTEKSTVWTLGVGGKDNVANVVTFTIGDDKYLNNNGSDCNDGTCVNLKANSHPGGPATNNACSLWELKEYNPSSILNVRLAELIEAARAYKAGDNVGNYTIASIATLAAAIATAEAVDWAEQEDIDALQAAINSLSVNMPSPAKFYKLVKPDAGNQVAYAQSNNSCSWGENTTPAGVWVFEKGSADNKFYLRNLSTGSYTTSYNKDATVVLGEKNQEVTVVYHGANRQMGIAPNGGQQLNRASGRLCAWTDDPGLNSNSAWIIEEVAPAEITHTLNISEVKWASLMLGFNAEIPEGLTAYVGTLAKDCLTLNKVKDVLPAETPVVIKAEEDGDYAFNYSNTSASTGEISNDLQGTLFEKPVDGIVYTLQSDDEGGVVFRQYTNEDNTVEAPTLGANKAYLVLAPNSASAISIRFGEEDTTEIETSALDPQPSTEIYDLMGRRVLNPAKGVYIVNGKKIVF